MQFKRFEDCLLMKARLIMLNLSTLTGKPVFYPIQCESDCLVISNLFQLFT